MIVEIKKDQIVLGEQLYMILVDGEIIYSNMNYKELCEITLGDLDRCGNFDNV